MHAAFLPERIDGLPGDNLLVPSWATPFSTLIAHAGFLHLGLNMLALIVFGRAVEPAVGWFGLLFLYLAGACAAAAGFYFVHPDQVPWVGAGGAVGALLGAQAMLFGRHRAPPGKRRLGVWTYALWLCAGWTVLSLLVVFSFMARYAVYYATPYLAGFAAGGLLAKPLLLLHYRNA